MRGAGWGVGLCALGAAVLGAGCHNLFTPGEPRLVRTVAKSLAPPIAADGLSVESVLLERPAGDPFLDRELWASVSPAGSPETRTLMAENGLRAGVLTGHLPSRFQELLDTETETVDSRRRTFNTRKEAVIATAGPVDPCRFVLLADLAGRPKSMELKQARCGLFVKPTPADSGRVRVACEPQIQHGERREWIRPTEDGTGFAKFEEVPLEKFPDLAFEVTLAPDDCLVVGWDAAEAGTLGSVLFGVEADGRPRQRVLVIRARQNTRPGFADLPAIPGPLRRR